MERFVTRHGDRIAGILSGFDRMIFRGTLRSLSYAEGLEAFLATRHVLLKEVARFAQRVSDRVKQHAEAIAWMHGRPFEYLASAATSKEATARAIMTRDGITRRKMGPVPACPVLRGNRAARYDIHRDRVRKHIHPELAVNASACISILIVRRPGVRLHARARADLAAADD